MKHIRIQIDGNKSYLVYQRGLITEYAAIHKYVMCRTPIKKALQELRSYISFERSAMRDRSPIKPVREESGGILRLLKEKRAQYARQCFDSKKPITLHKHVGVEIEFISKSDRSEIAKDLATLGVEKYVELKRDGSVEGDNDGDTECNGGCRDDCECAYCNDTHYCETQRGCDRLNRSCALDEPWEVRDNCKDCTETETLDHCDCGGKDESGEDFCKGEHVVCEGHCPGHNCQGYEHHEDDYDCQCECGCGNGETGHEIAIVARSSEIASVVRKVCQVLRQHNAEVNSTCGLHVHVDARNSDENKMFSNLVKSQKLLYAMVPRSRYKNTYCQPNERGMTMKAYDGRYWGINPASYQEHKTIEVRLHSGSINADKINYWIKLLQKIAYAKSVKKVNKLSDLTSKIKLDNKLIAYINNRLNKFQREHIATNLDFTYEECSDKDKQIDLNLMVA